MVPPASLCLLSVGKQKAHFLKGSCGSLASTQYMGGKVQFNLPLVAHNATPESQRQPYTCAWEREEPWMFPIVVSTLRHAAWGDHPPECIWLAQNAPGEIGHNEYLFQSGFTGQQDVAFFQKVVFWTWIFLHRTLTFPRYIWKKNIWTIVLPVLITYWMNA